MAPPAASRVPPGQKVTVTCLAALAAAQQRHGVGGGRTRSICPAVHGASIPARATTTARSPRLLVPLALCLNMQHMGAAGGSGGGASHGHGGGGSSSGGGGGDRDGDVERMGKWSVGEDRALRDAVEELGTSSWDRIASDYYAGRHTAAQCQVRWTKVSRGSASARGRGRGRDSGYCCSGHGSLCFLLLLRLLRSQPRCLCACLLPPSHARWW